MLLRRLLILLSLSFLALSFISAKPKGLCEDESQKNTVRIVRRLAMIAQIYYSDVFKYPDCNNIHKFVSLVKEQEPDIVVPTEDAWGNEIAYSVSIDQEHFRVVSPGADGVFEEGSRVIADKASHDTPCYDLNADIIWEDNDFVQQPKPKSRQ